MEKPDEKGEFEQALKSLIAAVDRELEKGALYLAA